jgi:hypothetical protein
MEREMPRIGSVPDMERVREAATPELVEGFASNPELSFAIVGQSGNVYSFGTEEDRAEAEDFCRPGHPRDEPLFIFGRPARSE